jgi:hypothetical protein
MVRPHLLYFTLDLDIGEGLLVVSTGKGYMIFGVPVFGQNDVLK